MPYPLSSPIENKHTAFLCASFYKPICWGKIWLSCLKNGNTPDSSVDDLSHRITIHGHHSSSHKSLVTHPEYSEQNIGNRVLGIGSTVHFFFSIIMWERSSWPHLEHILGCWVWQAKTSMRSSHSGGLLSSQECQSHDYPRAWVCLNIRYLNIL